MAPTPSQNLTKGTAAAAKPQLPIPQSPLDILTQTHTYLRRYTFHFRNGDRHTLSFRHAQMLRRQLAHLLAEWTDDDSVGAGGQQQQQQQQQRVSRANSAAGTGAGGPKARARIRMWQERGLVETWWTAFTQLARHSNVAKGVFLIAVLAEVGGVVGWEGGGGEVDGREDLGEGVGVRDAGARLGI
ncbi:hypothetical protein EJ05DRAFT_512512 [Pseudovirgaria hyperparasitica]|uniref:Uncharacterized protein n=1 Tax=Pseudovirgaria hyperparasitica TaxID=470096 RepID=A0A6A6VZ57_9PEZI|nr:uncharacterized protein EJ05DRAFT_512512 [Pseudovirgaria hyperparasitica]KAF2755932.1 hypothetical protein EJ05DRAFT_512512 [Pseudovirgaria hyperparasitica]